MASEPPAVIASSKVSESTAAHGLTVRNVTSYSSKVTLKISLICLSYSLLLVTVMLMNSWAWVGPDSGGAAGLLHPWHPLRIHHPEGA